MTYALLSLRKTNSINKEQKTQLSVQFQFYFVLAAQL